MVSKTQTTVPPPPSIQLETIYEESGGSLSSSINDLQHKIASHDQSSIYRSNQTFHGLISARSIPTVDAHRRQKAFGYQSKPPIEVRFRDGTKRYIQPSLTSTSTMLKRKKNSRSSNQDSLSRIKINAKSRQIPSTLPKKKQQLPKDPEIILTIITAEELTQSGITPPSTSSIDESDTLAIVKSQSNSSLDTIKTVTDVSISETAPTATVQQVQSVITIPPSSQPSIDITVSSHHFPSAPRHHAKTQEQEQNQSPSPPPLQYQLQQYQQQQQQQKRLQQQLPQQQLQEKQQQLYQQQLEEKQQQHLHQQKLQEKQQQQLLQQQSQEKQKQLLQQKLQEKQRQQQQLEEKQQQQFFQQKLQEKQRQQQLLEEKQRQQQQLEEKQRQQQQLEEKQQQQLFQQKLQEKQQQQLLQQKLQEKQQQQLLQQQLQEKQQQLLRQQLQEKQQQELGQSKQQLNTTRSQSLPPAQIHLSSSTQYKSISNQVLPVAIVPPSLKKTPPSLQITLTNDENERNFTSTINISQSTSSSSKQTDEKASSQQQSLFQPATTVLVGGGSRSAFRPFHKQTTTDQKSQAPVNATAKSQISTDQNKEKSPHKSVNESSYPYHHQYQNQEQQQPHQQHRTTSLVSMTRSTLQESSGVNPIVHDRRSISLDASKRSIRSNMSNQVVSDKTIHSNSKAKNSNSSQQSPRISSENITNNTSNQKEPIDNEYRDLNNRSTFIDPSLQWYSVTSKSLYEVPRLSNKYADVPLRITLPDRSPTHNQKLLKKHDAILENRLLKAGLSPETIALYERVLEVADVRQIAMESPPKIIDPHRRK